ncbi:hypothetical protein PENTCL1PPCAC_29537, partial [Pristionchus entomophagus]
AAFIGLEYLIFNRPFPDVSEWKRLDDPSFFCDNRPNCYPHPTNASLCGRPFTCHQSVSEWDRAHCTVNETGPIKGDLVFVLQANAQMEETIHKTATKIWEIYEKKLIVLFDDDEAADLCKIRYDNPIRRFAVPRSRRMARSSCVALFTAPPRMDTSVNWRRSSMSTIRYSSCANLSSSIRSSTVTSSRTLSHSTNHCSPWEEPSSRRPHSTTSSPTFLE